MFRRRPPEARPPWAARVEQARRLIDEQHPPGWLAERLDAVERAITAADADRTRLREVSERLDLEAATAELKAAVRRARPGEEALIESLRDRFDSINRIHNQADELDRKIEGALVDLDVLAARSVEIAALRRDWSLDDAVRRLGDDLLALEQAHEELEGL